MDGREKDEATSVRMESAGKIDSSDSLGHLMVLSVYAALAMTLIRSAFFFFYFLEMQQALTLRL